MAVLYCSMCLTEAAKHRCGSELLSDLLFVCGDRGIYLGKGSGSGYRARPRGKGIVEKCCLSAGCDLYHLEMYCAKPKRQQGSTTSPSITTAPQRMFQAVFHKRLLEHLGGPDSSKREAYKKKGQPSLQRRNKASLSHRRVKALNTTAQPPILTGTLL
ncbi:insulin-like growth factor 3 [Pholidichthys leucotaenia]